MTRTRPSSPYLFNRVSGRSFLCVLTLVLAAVSINLAARAQQSPGAASQPDTKGQGGTVFVRVQSDSGRPLAEAIITLFRNGVRNYPNSRVIADEKGEFRFKNVPPGVYSVSAQYYGYYIASTDNSVDPDRRLVLPGDSLIISMTKGAAITGKVTNQQGEPMVRMNVNAIKVRNVEGTTTSGTTTTFLTDDRGIYRIYGLTAGSYIVCASGANRASRIATTNPYYDSVPTYYPANSRSSAKEVSVTVGGEASGIDIRFGPVQGRTISGTVSNPMWIANTALSVSLMQVEARDVRDSVIVRQDSPDHSFKFTGVADGEYEITAFYSAPGGQINRAKTQQFKAKGNDVTGMNLALTTTASVAGRMVYEDNPATAQSGQCRQRTVVPLLEILAAARIDDHVQNDLPGALTFVTAADEKGVFQISDLDQGRYQINARLPNDDLYVASVIYAGRRPAAIKPVSSKAPPELPNLIAVGDGERVQGIVVKLSNGAAAITGRLALSAEGPITPDSFRVYLLPANDDLANDASHYHERSIGSDGKFAIKNIAPGKYCIVALPSPRKADRTIPVGQMVFDSTFRAAVRKDAEAKGVSLDLKPCQKASDLSLKMN